MDIEKIEFQSLECVSKGEALLLLNPKTEEEYKEFLDNFNKWVADCFNLYLTNLPEKYAKFFGEGFKQKNNMYAINIPFHTPDIEEKIRKIRSDIRDKISKLQFYCKDRLN